MQFNIFKPKAQQGLPKITEDSIVDFFSGTYEKDVFDGKELLGIRAIETSRNNNDVDIIFCKAFQGDTPRITHKDGLKPFLWSKQFKTSTFFRHNVVTVSEKNVFEGRIKLPNGDIKPICGSDIKILKKTEEGYTVRYKIEDINEWKKIVTEKQRLYGIKIEAQIESFDKKQVVKRIQDGFKNKITIQSSKDKKFSDNPYFPKKIVGSYANLMDFFKEAGLSLRGTVYLDDQKLKELVEYLSTDLNTLIYFYICLYRHREHFSPFTKNSVDFDKLIGFYKKQYPAIAYKIDKKFINDLIDKNFNDVYNRLIDSDLKLGEIFKIALDENKLNDYIIKCYTFDDNLDKRDLAHFIDTIGVDLTYKLPTQIYSLQPLEQYMIQTGRRLFKGIENYEELNALMIDIETTAQDGNEEIEIAALRPELGRIFQIGIKTTDGYTRLLEANNNQEEIEIITEAYKIISELDPDLVLTYNGESFDFPFLEKRLELLGCVAEESGYQDEQGKKTSLQYIRNIVAEGYEKYGNVYSFFTYRKMENTTVKIGNTTEKFTQTKMWGKNICDVMYAVKRAAAQDVHIPNAKLKDNIKHANLASVNRVYVPGDMIGKTAADKRPYYLSEEDGSYFVSSKTISKEELFSKESIHEGEHNFFYGNLKKLYIKASGEYSKFPILDKCLNVFTFDLENLTKELIDEQFTNLYKDIVQYEGIVTPLEGFGNQLKEDSVLWEYFLQKRKEFAKNLEDVKSFYDHVDFSKLKVVTGAYIVQRYLSDDLDEPYLLDKLYSQSTFSLAKWLPTSYEKVAVTGNATVWKLLLSTWSYLNCVTIPDYEVPKKYTGGLLGMVASGYHKNIVKIDFSSQYPATFLAHCKNPDIDITGVYKPLLEYALKNRLNYKDLKNVAKRDKNSEMEQYYDKKQLPLKILINSFYGMLGAPDVSPFCHIQSAWHITCASRQNMRHMIKYFGKEDFKIVYFHTDGANFVIPEGIENYKYVGTGKSWLTEKGKEYEGIEAFVAEYNDIFMIGYTGVAIDEYAVSCVNFAKGNFSYVKESKGKYKISHVGGGLVNKAQSEYIVDFYEANLLDLLLGKTAKFIDAYYAYIKKIYNGDLIARKIASKNKVKKPLDDYVKGVFEKRYAKQAHMELAVRENLQVEVGDVIYKINDNDDEKEADRATIKNCLGYFVIPDEKLLEKAIKRLESIVSNGKEEFKTTVEKCSNEDTFFFNSAMEKFSDINGIQKRTKVSKEKDLDSILEADNISFKIKVKKSKKNGDRKVIEVFIEKDVLYCSLVPNDKLDAKLKYNPMKYIKKLNKALELIWIVFHPDIRSKIPSPNKLYSRNANERAYFIDAELQLVSGFPLEGKEDKQQDMDELMQITDDEYEFWEMVDLSPNSPFDYKEVFVDQNYIVNRNTNKIKQSDFLYLESDEVIMSGRELMRFLGDKILIDVEKPPYEFV